MFKRLFELNLNEVFLVSEKTTTPSMPLHKNEVFHYGCISAVCATKTIDVAKENLIQSVLCWRFVNKLIEIPQFSIY